MLRREDSRHSGGRHGQELRRRDGEEHEVGELPLHSGTAARPARHQRNDDDDGNEKEGEEVEE